MLNRLLAVLLGLIALATLALGAMAWDRLYNDSTPLGLVAAPAGRAAATPAKATHMEAGTTAPGVAESTQPDAPPAESAPPATTEPAAVTPAPPTAPPGPDPALGAARRYAAGLEREVVRMAIAGLADRVSRDAKLIVEHSVEAARRASVGDGSFSTSPAQVCTTTLPAETTALDLIHCHMASVSRTWPESASLREHANSTVHGFVARHRESLSQALGFDPSANALGSRAMNDAAAARDTLVELMRELARSAG